MNFDGAIQAHSLWKQKLSQYLKNPDGSLKSDEVALDNKCELGQWIYGEGAKYSNLSEYNDLKEEHAQFHKRAADVVRKADAGQSVSEEIEIGADSPFALASSTVVFAILDMKEKVG